MYGYVFKVIWRKKIASSNIYNLLKDSRLSTNFAHSEGVEFSVATDFWRTIELFYALNKAKIVSRESYNEL